MEEGIKDKLSNMVLRIVLLNLCEMWRNSLVFMGIIASFPGEVIDFRFYPITP